MKVNQFEMLIKFAAIYILCVNLIVLSVANPLSAKENLDKESAAATSTSKEDYDEVSSIEKTSDPSLTDTKPPPLVFPESESDQATTKNATALEILQSNTSTINNKAVDENIVNNNEENRSSPIATDDNSSKNKENASIEAEYDEHVEKKKEDEEKTNSKEENRSNDDKIEKEKDYDEKSTNNDEEDDVENIQEDGQDQGKLEETFGLNETSINVFEEPTLNKGHIALIFATSLIFLSATAYVGLVLWRKSLEHRYGMRQRLVTEDDYYNNNDVRFFGL